MKPIELLECAILDLAPKHHPDENAPNSYRELATWAQSHTKEDSLPVYNGSSNKTIYSSNEINFAFRAWHDKIHIRYYYDFSYAHEMQVAEMHTRELLKWASIKGYNRGLALQAAALVYADVAGQVEYYYHHGKYVDNQKSFVYNYISNGFELDNEEY